jgi:hypothetical protein
MVTERVTDDQWRTTAAQINVLRRMAQWDLCGARDFLPDIGA